MRAYRVHSVEAGTGGGANRGFGLVEVDRLDVGMAEVLEKRWETIRTIRSPIEITLRTSQIPVTVDTLPAARTPLDAKRPAGKTALETGKTEHHIDREFNGSDRDAARFPP